MREERLRVAALTAARRSLKREGPGAKAPGPDSFPTPSPKPLNPRNHVEARGFEPRSETGSTTASTCIAHRSGSPETGRRAADSRTSLLKFRPAPEGVTPDYPDIAILMKPPRAGFFMSRCSNAKRYAASARLLLAVVIFPSVLPGLRSPGHAATASPTPSKPSRPQTPRKSSGSRPRDQRVGA